MAKNTVISARRYIEMRSRVFFVDGDLEYAYAAITAFVIAVKLSAGFRCHRGKQSGSGSLE
jgi:hypothetical protein